MRSRLTLVIAAVLLLAASSPSAQIIYGQPAGANFGVAYSSWSLDVEGITTDITQMAIPFRGFVPIRDNFEISLYVDNSSNTVDISGLESKLNGLGDVRVQASHSFMEDQVVFSLGLNLPTGKKELSANEEATVLALLAQNYLNLPMRRFGQGLGISATAGLAQMLGEWRCGVGASYRYTGEYDPYEGYTDYNPGDVMTVNAGADRMFGATAFSLNLIFSSYGADKTSDVKTFQQSTQMAVQAGLGHELNSGRLNFGLGYLSRGKNDLFVGENSELKYFGDEFTAFGQYMHQLNQQVQVGPMVEYRSIGANDLDFGSTSLIGFGAGLIANPSQSFGVNLGFTYSTGTTDGGDIDVTGLQATLGLSASL